MLSRILPFGIILACDAGVPSIVNSRSVPSEPVFGDEQDQIESDAVSLVDDGIPTKKCTARLSSVHDNVIRVKDMPTGVDYASFKVSSVDVETGAEVDNLMWWSQFQGIKNGETIHFSYRGPDLDPDPTDYIRMVKSVNSTGDVLLRVIFEPSFYRIHRLERGQEFYASFVAYPELMSPAVAYCHARVPRKSQTPTP